MLICCFHVSNFSSYSDAKGFKLQYSAADNDLSIFAIILGAGLFGFVLSRITPRKWYIGWWLGWAVLGPLAGMSVAMTMIMLKSGDDMLFSSMVGRWILIAVCGVIGLFAVSLTKWTGAVSYTTWTVFEEVSKADSSFPGIRHSLLV